MICLTRLMNGVESAAYVDIQMIKAIIIGTDGSGTLILGEGNFIISHIVEPPEEVAKKMMLSDIAKANS